MVFSLDRPASPTASSGADDQEPAAPHSPGDSAENSTRRKTPPKLNPVRVMRAMGNPIRWGILQILSDGKPAAAMDLARHLKADPDNVAKHLRVLELAGLISSRPGQDARLRLYAFRSTLEMEEKEGMRLYDLGFCILRFQSPSAR
ncbi:MAG: ArsR family transcriptional regulator [Verrucomicrobiaceae bacterium]|nr:MAG: ArsR family transcriptional regulator [Verrucomicrobiaceae bacterium]